METVNFNDVSSTSWMTKDFNRYWYRLNNRENVGDMTYLYNKYQPTSYEDFYVKYTTDTVGENPKWHGRSEEELDEIAKRYQELSNRYDVNLSTFKNNIIWHTIVQTFDGHKKELELKQYLNSLGHDVRGVDPELDAKYGVDLAFYKGGQLRFYIQVKPYTFILGNSNWSLINDRKLALQKGRQLQVPTYFAFYDKSGKWLTNPHIVSRLTDYIDNNGYTKLTHQ